MTKTGARISPLPTDRVKKSCEKVRKSVIDFPSTYTVLDIETTGLDPRYCEIIEISAMKYSSGQNIGTFSTLVKPSEPIDEYITSLTGITNDMLKSAPDISETMQKFYNFVGSDLIVGYNVNFDINFYMTIF